MEVLEPVTYSDLKEMWDSVNGVAACDEAILKHLAEDMNLDTDADWAQILDHQPIVLNDRMMTDAVQSPHIQSEHSYSLTLNDEMPHSPFGHNIKLEDYSKEMECFPCADVLIKQEPASPPASPHPHSLLKPTIILAPRLKVEPSPPPPPPPSSGFPLPPTPPSCNGSDSEGSPSPASTPPRRPKHSPLISSQPKGATGVLQLTDEEKRTLLAEGYHIPQKLPLTKAEERSLKKIRRKIKNKISAQESRRKKKEYMDALEKKVQILSSENNDYKKKVDSLEGSNKSLLSQLQHLQALLDDMPNKRSRNVATQTISSSTLARTSNSCRSEISTEFIESTDAKGR